MYTYILYTLVNSLFQSKCFFINKVTCGNSLFFVHPSHLSFLPSGRSFTPVPSGSVRQGDQVENLGVLLLVAKVRVGSDSQDFWGQDRGQPDGGGIFQEPAV